MGLQIVQWALETGDMEFDADAAEIIEDTPFLVQIAQALHFFCVICVFFFIETFFTQNNAVNIRSGYLLHMVPVVLSA